MSRRCGGCPTRLPWAGPEELEGGDHPLEDRLGALERQRDGERCVGVGPGRDQKRDEPAAVGEIDMDVAEVGLEALTREMSQRDKGLLVPRPVLSHVALHLGISTRVAVLVAKTTEELRGRVPLLGRCVVIGAEDLVDEGLEGSQLGGGPVPGQGLGMGFGLHQGMPDGFSRVTEVAGDLSDGQAITPGPPNRSIIIHG